MAFDSLYHGPNNEHASLLKLHPGWKDRRWNDSHFKLKDGMTLEGKALRVLQEETE